jgi:hypothetical protein
MSKRQIYDETKEFIKARKQSRVQLSNALESADFAEVEPQPFDLDPGKYGMPVTEELEKTLLAAHTSQTGEYSSDDQIGLLLQIDALEAFRRSNLARKQGRREMLVHLRYTLEQEDKYDGLFKQQIVGTDKIGSVQ